MTLLPKPSTYVDIIKSCFIYWAIEPYQFLPPPGASGYIKFVICIKYLMQFVVSTSPENVVHKSSTKMMSANHRIFASHPNFMCPTFTASPPSEFLILLFNAMPYYTFHYILEEDFLAWVPNHKPFRTDLYVLFLDFITAKYISAWHQRVSIITLNYVLFYDGN